MADPTDDAITSQQVVEIAGSGRSIGDVALHRAEMLAWPTPAPWEAWRHRLSDWMEADEACHQDVLERLRQEGPLPVGSLPDTCVHPWRSSGWNDGKNTRMLVAHPVQRGEVAVAGLRRRAGSVKRATTDGRREPARLRHRLPDILDRTP